MALSKLPKAFGFEELKKGYFPHFFNTKSNESYVGKLPPMQDYGCNSMMPEARREFEKWYKEMIVLQERGEYVFDMKKELIQYCCSDVDILFRRCSEFRRLFMEMTRDGEQKGIDPFRESCTLAGACNFVYRCLFMPEDSIGRVPPFGYSPKKLASAKALKWLHTIRVRESCEIQDALHKGEKYMYIRGCGHVDGYRVKKDANGKETKIAYGSMWHFCISCFGHTTVNPVTKKTMGTHHQENMRMVKNLEKRGIQVIEIWEHEYDKLIKEDPEFKKLTQQCDVTPPLVPRNAFKGGGGAYQCLSIVLRSERE